MSESIFDYDVFLSFASGDEDVVRPIWQHLTISGLRVFWSDVTLRDRVGTSWFDVIQDAISRSRHLVVVCSPASLDSKWVKREYVAFFNHHYSQPTRRLVPLLTSGTSVTDLPLFLRDIEAISLGHDGSLVRLVRALGGVDIDGLQRELARRDEELTLLRAEVISLNARLRTAETQRENPRAAPRSTSYSHQTAQTTAGSGTDQSPPNTDFRQVLKKFLVGSEEADARRAIRHLSKKTGMAEEIVVVLLIGLLVFVAALLQSNC